LETWTEEMSHIVFEQSPVDVLDLFLGEMVRPSVWMITLSDRIRDEIVFNNNNINPYPHTVFEMKYWP